MSEKDELYRLTKEPTHVVVTRYQAGRGVKPIVHSYGPYTHNQAVYQRKKLRESYEEEVAAGTLEVSACKMISTEQDAVRSW